MPLAWLPWEILDEPRFKNPVQWGLFTWSQRVPGDFEGCVRFLLGEYSNRAVVPRGDREGLLGHGLDATIERGLFELDRTGLISGVFEH